MAKFIIKGQKPLGGKIYISGAKNAALKMLAATVLAKDLCVLNNVPRIFDIEVMLEILRSIGAKTKWVGPHRLEIDPSHINSWRPDFKLVAKMRASVVLAGPLLARFGKAEIAKPGGCVIGARPVYIHWKAFQKMGVSVNELEKSTLLIAPKKLKDQIVVLDEMSVTATENVLMLAAGFMGHIKIHIAACEPEIQNLASMLNKMGAKIRGAGTHEISVDGVKDLHGAVINVIPDRIEAGTYIVAAAITNGDVIIKKVIPTHLEMVFNKLDALGVNYEIINQKGKFADIHIKPPHKLRPTKIDTRTYPGFPTDLQAPFSVLLTQCPRKSKVFESLYEDRLKYCGEMKKMGADINIIDNRTAEFSGPAHLKSADITSFDLRAGATLILAGLIAHGETTISNIETIDRGYERIDYKLRRLGAQITRKD